VIERRVDAMSELGEVVGPARNPVNAGEGAAVPCPALPDARVPAGFDVMGAATGVGLGGGALARGGGGGRIGSGVGA